MTEREVMAAAYAGDALDFDRIDIVAFTPVAPSPQTIAGDPRDDDDARDDDASVAPAPERQVPRVPLALGPWAGKAWRDHAVASPPLEVAALEERERELLADAARRPEVPTLRLRGMRRAPALEALADQVARARDRGLAYLRVITGKGVDSPGAPILKEAVIAWCSGDGALAVAAWAPERDRFGEYGSLLLRLRRRG